MKRPITRATLFGSGALLGLIGGALMASPKAFLELSHVYVERDPGLMSELTAPSGLLALAGAFLMLGAMKQRVANPALIVGAIVYGSYGIGRLVSIGLHGLPPGSLITATVIELVMALLLGGLWASRRADKQSVIMPHAVQMAR